MTIKVALSGAGGNVGRILRVELQKRGVDLRCAGGRSPLEPLHAGEDVMHGDLSDPAVVDRLLQGVDVLVHMAGTSVERPLPEIIQNKSARPFRAAVPGWSIRDDRLHAAGAARSARERCVTNELLFRTDFFPCCKPQTTSPPDVRRGC